MEELMQDWSQRSPWVGVAVAAAIGLLVAWALFHVSDALFKRVLPHTRFLKWMVPRARQPVRWLLPALVLHIVVQNAPDELGGIHPLRQFLTVLVMACGTWMLARAVSGLGDAVEALRPVDVADNLTARRVQTQTRVITRLVMGFIALVGVALILMTFPSIRQLGTSLLASAGLAGIAAGFAARPILGNLLAGLQIAFSQPIRLDDVVIVEGEWGRIEEITGTYVVVRIWDQRRLVVPLQWWIEHPFQNWTRHSADLLGTVFLWVDYRMPLAPLREALQRVCEGSPLWDGRVCLVQVTDFSERAMQLRCLVSTADSGKGWDLRCLVREELMSVMQRDYPAYLPQLRAQLDGRPQAPDSEGNRPEPFFPAPASGPMPEQRSPTPEHEGAGHQR